MYIYFASISYIQYFQSDMEKIICNCRSLLTKYLSVKNEQKLKNILYNTRDIKFITKIK
jgi:hypothetical protein